MALKKINDSQEPKLMLNTKASVDLSDWNLDEIVELDKSPTEWMSNLANWLLPFCLGIRTEDGSPAREAYGFGTLIELSWPFGWGRIRNRTWATDPLDLDIDLRDDRDDIWATARYNLRELVMERLTDTDARIIDSKSVVRVQRALRKLADDLQPIIDAKWSPEEDEPSRPVGGDPT